ncbi:MAG TPA: glycoside hydrolase family 15 protein [Thermomicrobiales bacterium]|nr:glycoside hydrolase family 15 protein [Thermomicrobiales bacterium]
MAEPSASPYPPIADYALLSDCHSAALVSRAGSIDWCCMPRMDWSSCFGRLLDWEHGGYCSIAPHDGGATTFRDYVDGTLVLETTVTGDGGEAHIYDCFTMREGGKHDPRRQLLRIVEGTRGRVSLRLELVPRFDYGEVAPWLQHRGVRLYSAIGGNDGLVIYSDADLQIVDRHDLTAEFTVRAGERVRLSLSFARPEELDANPPQPLAAEDLDRRLEETLAWWRRWSSQARLEGPDGPAAVRSAITLRALTNAPTGALAAAPTTSLPETPGGERNWDYRYSWIRDSAFSVRSLADIGCAAEADAFRRFIERSAAGSAAGLQIMYGLGGERRLTETCLDNLEGYRGAKPVRVGNAASKQLQLDAYGDLLDLTWRWHQRGYSPDDDYWRFLLDLVDTAAERWREPDHGIWEMRGEPRHFVYSKVMCWAAVDRGLRLAESCLRQAPVRRWTKVRDEIRAAVETEGYDKKRGIFVQSFGSKALDASLLLLPTVDFLSYDDERMVRTTDAIRAHLDRDGLLLRYRVDETKDNLKGEEGVFLACAFWLAECLARQGRLEDARAVFDRAASTSNDLGLFAEEYAPDTGDLLGNFPQGLTHLSHIAAAVAMAQERGLDLRTQAR